MVVFFHGHGANLAEDVFDRQQVPQQITADSSAGKFWEPNGFKRFLDEAAVKLARMYGDQHTAFTFARMPIVIVAYSGGFAPTLAQRRSRTVVAQTISALQLAAARQPFAFRTATLSPMRGPRIPSWISCCAWTIRI
jgi:hypothetical protein